MKSFKSKILKTLTCAMALWPAFADASIQVVNGVFVEFPGLEGIRCVRVWDIEPGDLNASALQKEVIRSYNLGLLRELWLMGLGPTLFKEDVDEMDWFKNNAPRGVETHLFERLEDIAEFFATRLVGLTRKERLFINPDPDGKFMVIIAPEGSVMYPAAE